MAELSTLGAVIKTAYEGQADTNAFTDAEQAKLAGVDPIASLKSNLAAVVAPTANEDSGDGYAVGSRWVDVTADKEYVCLDATLTAAVWVETTAAGGAVEGTAVLSTGEVGGTKFLREDGDGTSSWQTVSAGSVEGTAVLSTGEAGGTKFLREDGDGTSSWQTVPVGTGDLRADGTVPLTADWDAGNFEIRSRTFESDVATGTAPLVVASSTVVANLNVSALQGNAASAFATAAHSHEGTAILSTGEALGYKVLTEDGDGTSSWRQVEGLDILSTGEAGSTKFLNTVGDGTCTWAVALTPLDVPLDNFAAVLAPTVDDDAGDGYTIGSRWININTDREYVCCEAAMGIAIWKEVTNETVEGTALLSTGEAGGTKFLREDGDGTCSWQTVSGTGDFKADGSVDMTGQFRTDVGTFDSDVADGASAVAYSYDTQVSYATAGSKLAQWSNNATPKAYIDKDGNVFPNRVSFNTDSYLHEGASNRLELVSGGTTTARVRMATSTSLSQDILWLHNNGLIQPLDGDFYIGAGNLGSNFPATDVVVPDIYVHALNARTSATTNLDGASVHVEGGDGASGSAGDADGGQVYLDGGQGYGTGTHGDVIVGNTRGNLVFANDYTVATLPAGIVGMVARVTDATAPAMGATVAGGGAAAALVWYNGANWTVIGI